MKFIKKIYEKINFSPYWHLECIIAIPVIIFFMVMSVLNYLK
jgi:hypothetical protein